MAAVTAAVAGAAIGVGSSVMSAREQRKGAEKAANAQREGNALSIAENRRQDRLNRAEALPWTEAGQWAIGQLQSGLQAGDFSFDNFESQNLINPDMFASGTFQGSRLNTDDYVQGEYQANQFDGNIDLQQDPSYQFRLEQGLNALDRSAASRGKLFSGQQIKQAQDYGQQSASQEYSNAFNRQMGVNDHNNALTAQQYGINQNRLNTMQGINNANYGRDYATYGSGVQQNALMADLTSQAYNQDLTRHSANNQTTQNNYNVLAGMSGAGQQQVQNTNALSTGISNNVAQTQSNTGAAIAQGHMNAANANANMWSGIGNSIGGAAGMMAGAPNGGSANALYATRVGRGSMNTGGLA